MAQLRIVKNQLKTKLRFFSAEEKHDVHNDIQVSHIHHGFVLHSGCVPSSFSPQKYVWAYFRKTDDAHAATHPHTPMPRLHSGSLGQDEQRTRGITRARSTTAPHPRFSPFQTDYEIDALFVF